MNLSDKTIEALRIIINGDGSGKIQTPYRSGYYIGEFFKEFSVQNDEVGSRWKRTQDILHKLNNTHDIDKVILKALNPVDYIESEDTLENVIEYFNRYLVFDGFKIEQKTNGSVSIVDVSEKSGVEIESKLVDSIDGSNLKEWINEHSDKCREKFSNEDYSGAITNARSMLEVLFKWILENTEGGFETKLNGDLPGMYKEVMRRFNIEPSEVSDALKRMISGLINVVHGLAELRNSASDSHGTKFKPIKRHAALAINSSRTVANYFIELCSDNDIIDEVKAEEYELMAYDSMRGSYMDK